MRHFVGDGSCGGSFSHLPIPSVRSVRLLSSITSASNKDSVSSTTIMTPAGSSFPQQRPFQVDRGPNDATPNPVASLETLLKTWRHHGSCSLGTISWKAGPIGCHGRSSELPQPCVPWHSWGFRSVPPGVGTVSRRESSTSPSLASSGGHYPRPWSHGPPV